MLCPNPAGGAHSAPPDPGDGGKGCCSPVVKVRGPGAQPPVPI